MLPAHSYPLYSTYLAILIFFCNEASPAETYTLSLHDALPISPPAAPASQGLPVYSSVSPAAAPPTARRSEEHTSELQSRGHLVCRLLLEKKETLPLSS